MMRKEVEQAVTQAGNESKVDNDTQSNKSNG